MVRSPASRIAFSAYACSRSREIGQAPYAACQSRLPKPGSGSGAASSSVTSVRSHSPGASASTAMRARTSSLRLVSWVDSVVIASGQSRCRAAIASWNSATVVEKTDGSPPTSLSEVRREYR